LVKYLNEEEIDAETRKRQDLERMIGATAKRLRIE
jgi:hypothetical protein